MGAGAVSVQRFHPSGAGSGVGPGPAGGYQWAVTFVGDNVGGNVDMLVAAEVQNLVATNPNMAIVEATAGKPAPGCVHTARVGRLGREHGPSGLLHLR